MSTNCSTKGGALGYSGFALRHVYAVALSVANIAPIFYEPMTEPEGKSCGK